MGKKGFFYNQDDCIGCKTCQMACKDKNDLPVGLVFRELRSYEVGDYPDAALYHFSATCNHCAKPACVEKCPKGAMYIDKEDGTVQHDDDACIGCQSCVRNCPYDVPQFIVERKITRKCDACIALRAAGEEPACVASCPMRCLEFGEMKDLIAAHKGAVRDLPIRPDSKITGACTLIEPKAAALAEGAREVTL